MLKIGVVGTGHLGKIHLQNLLGLSTDFEVVGFFDSNPITSDLIESEFNIKAFDELDELVSAVQALVIASPTDSHYSIAVRAMKEGKHVFIEKPVCFSVEESKKLLTYSQEAGVVVQVGHVERFNPAFTSVLTHIDFPIFIESQRLAPFQTRGSDVSVVLDLMIHDIDIALSVAHSNVKRITATGMEVLSSSIDIASVRLEFENGCVANLTASRIAEQKVRKTRFFMKESNVVVDFLNKQAHLSKVVCPSNGEAKYIQKDVIPVKDSNAIKLELLAFAQAVKEQKQPLVGLTDAHHALQIASLISDQIHATNQFLK
jgi:predicted dehydrogenase